MNEFKNINQLIVNSFDLLNYSFEDNLLSLEELKIIENKLEVYKDMIEIMIDKKS